MERFLFLIKNGEECEQDDRKIALNIIPTKCDIHGAIVNCSLNYAKAKITLTSHLKKRYI